MSGIITDEKIGGTNVIFQAERWRWINLLSYTLSMTGSAFAMMNFSSISEIIA